MERNSLKSVVMTVISYAVTLAGIAFFLSITATPGSAYMLVFALPLLFAVRLSASRSARQRPEAARKERLRNTVWTIAAALSVGINIFNYYHARHEMAVSPLSGNIMHGTDVIPKLWPQRVWAGKYPACVIIG